jgi:CBS domain-containing protein
VAGKLDWLAAGGPIEGSSTQHPRAGEVARRDVPTCGLDERLGEVQALVRASDWDACVVVNHERVVLGLLRAEELKGDPARRIEEAMRPGPSTFRPHVPILEMAHYMIDHDVENAPITTSDGRLVGLLLRTDALRTVHELHEREGDHGG